MTADTPQERPKPESTDGTIVISPYRPLTRSARDALAPYTILERFEPEGSGRGGGVVTRDRPPESLLDTHELTIKEPPDEVWETDHGKRIELYETPDRVVVAGLDANIDTDTAKDKCRTQDRFTRLTPAEEAPDG